MDKAGVIMLLTYWMLMLCKVLNCGCDHDAVILRSLRIDVTILRPMWSIITVRCDCSSYCSRDVATPSHDTVRILKHRCYVLFFKKHYCMIYVRMNNIISFVVFV